MEKVSRPYRDTFLDALLELGRALADSRLSRVQGQVTSRSLWSFSTPCAFSFCDYGAASSGIATSSSVAVRSFMDCLDRGALDP